eukprot:3728505-Rhodomonas_salina.2
MVIRRPSVGGAPLKPPPTHPPLLLAPWKHCPLSLSTTSRSTARQYEDTRMPVQQRYHAWRSRVQKRFAGSTMR